MNQSKDKKIIFNNDADGHFATCLTKAVNQWQPIGMYDFKNLYMNTDYIGHTKKEDLVWLDVSVLGNRQAIDMHVTKIHIDDPINTNSININNYMNIHRNNYTKKCAWGVHLATLSYFQPINLKNLTDQQKALLWLPDSSYESFYFDRDTFYHYVEMFGLQELAEVLEKYPKDNFKQFQNSLNMRGKIWVDSTGLLQTDIRIDEIQRILPMIDWSLPQGRYKNIQDFQSVEKEIYYSIPREHIYDDMFSFALTKKKKCKYSYINLNRGKQLHENQKLLFLLQWQSRKLSKTCKRDFIYHSSNQRKRPTNFLAFRANRSTNTRLKRL